MTSSVALYEALTSAPDERTGARVIAEAFERLEERCPHLPDLVTQGHLRESELRLKKDIEQVRAELHETEPRLKKYIEQLRAELKKDIEQVRGEIGRAKVYMLKWMVPLMFGQVALIAALVRLL